MADTVNMELANALRKHANWLHATYDFGYMQKQIDMCNLAADRLASEPCGGGEAIRHVDEAEEAEKPMAYQQTFKRAE